MAPPTQSTQHAPATALDAVGGRRGFLVGGVMSAFGTSAAGDDGLDSVAQNLGIGC